MGRYLEHETGVLSEPLDFTFVASVDEDRSIVFGAVPEGVVDQISLLKGVVALRMIIEVIKNLSEELGSVRLV